MTWTRVKENDDMIGYTATISVKKHIADFMIEFKALAMKAETDDMHTIFLLKKNVRADTIKTILGYLPIAAPDILKE